MMNDVLAVPDTRVEDLLKSDAAVIRFFIHQQTACVGCYLAKFCTLEDVINTYKLNEQSFLSELSKIISQKS
ncbi:MAG TPA: hypothetical protein PLQ94_07680 [Anaerolineales bacterium]|nr:hypothetical protein [Anaerolineales bacterium]